MDILKEVARLRHMKTSELRAKYEELFGDTTRSGNKQFLVRKIAWRMQAEEEGGLSERARKRAAELANDLDIRTRTPAGMLSKPTPGHSNIRAVRSDGTDDRLPISGTTITREYKGRTHLVKVLSGGFEYEGRPYRSLSAIAREITGSHWNGFLFFGLTQKE